MSDAYIPYCGPAPTPETIWAAWNFDPFVVLALAAGALFMHYRATGTGARRAGQAGILVLAIAFISPLCALSTALFSARIGHHLLMIAVAAPLLALALPSRKAASPLLVSATFMAHTLLVWLWHAPSIYGFALAGDSAYWLMEVTLLGSAFLMWRAILGARDNIGSALAALLGSLIQMGLLGALLTFARHPLYAPHFATTEAFGLSPLADQQLAGLIMWVPAALPYLAAGLLIIAAFLRDRAPDAVTAAHGGRRA